LTYAELNGRANQLARHLETMGVGPEVAVGVLLERTVDLYVALLGIMKAGGIYVPLDPTYPSDRLAHMAIDAAVGVVLTGQGEAHLVSGGPWKTIDIRAFHDAFSLYAEDNLPTRLLPENLAYIMYTSGSTGKPKGVGISHSALTNQMQWCANAFGINATDRFLHKASIGFDSSIEEILCPLTCGARIVASRPRGEYDLEYLAALIEREAVTCVDLAPSLLAALMDVTPTQGWLSVRLVISGGEALKPDLADAFKARCPAVLANTYGPTETTVQCAWTTDLGAEKRVAIGRPVANTQLYVLDAYMQPVPMGAHGELYVGGTGVARGYLNRAGATADAFLPDPFSTKGERLYRTGDQVLWRSDGQLEFLGRMDHQVKLRGYRIELAEVEQSIEAIAGIKHAVAAIRDDGRGEPALAAYVVAEERLDTNELRDALRSRLPRHMVPTYWMQLSQLPLNANGKIDRRQLPELDANMASADYTSPRNSLESVICAVFQDLLQSERIGVHDNFFDLGGHSLSATRAMTRLSTTLNASLPVRLLFEAPTPAQLARATGLPMSRADDIDPESSDEEHPSAETERMLASLETLSEDEVELLLAQLSGEV
jgi:amino acid adenylation domain-containing protein